MIDLILAADLDNGIGKDGDIPWYFPEDLQHFKKLTENGIVLMGRKTWESLPEKYRPLPNRTNVVVGGVETQHGSHFAFPGYDLEEAIAFCQYIEHFQGGPMFCIGGAKLANELLENGWVNELYLTRVKARYDCDTFLDVPKRYSLYETTYETKNLAFEVWT